MAMGHREKLVDGNEIDAFCDRGTYHWGRGVLRAIKRQAGKRARRAAGVDLGAAGDEGQLADVVRYEP